MGRQARTRHRWPLTAALGCLLAFSAARPAPAPAAIWDMQKLPAPPRYTGDTTMGSLLAISCTSRSFCLAGGHFGRLLVSTDPTGGPSQWRHFYVPPGSDNESAPPPGAPPPPEGGPHVKGVACPSARLCIAVSGSGDIYSSTDPTGGTEAWSRADIDGTEYETHLEAVSCPTVSFCVAVSGGRKSHANPLTSGKVLSSHNPDGGAAAWHETQLDETLDLRGVSCPSPSLCVAVGQEGRMVVSTNPDGGPAAWQDVGTPGGPSHLQGIDCVGALCVAGSASGNLLTTSELAESPGQWSVRNGGRSVPITGISCPSTTQCIAVDDNGNVLTSHNPTGGSDAWSVASVIPYVAPGPLETPDNAMFGVSCPSASFCAISAADATVLTSTDPFDTAPGNEGGGGHVRRPLRPRAIIARVDGRKRATGKRRIRARFRFFARTPVRGFVCAFDGSRYKPCRSPAFHWIGLGWHAFKVRAVGPTGLRGPVAIERFKLYPADGTQDPGHPPNQPAAVG